MSWLESLSYSANIMPPVIFKDTSSQSLDEFIENDPFNVKHEQLEDISTKIILNNTFSTKSSTISSNDSTNIEIHREAKKCSSKDLEMLQIEMLDLTRHLNHTIKDLKWEFDELWKANEQLERDLMKLNQYNRRENLEITGIPDDIPNNKIEVFILNVLRKIGLQINHYDIVACHRLNVRTNGCKNVIIRFMNRKHAHMALSNKKRLLEFPNLKHINIIENLCPQSKSIYEKCQKLIAENTINHTWTYNGKFFIKSTNKRSERGKIISHENDIFHLIHRKGKSTITPS